MAEATARAPWSLPPDASVQGWRVDWLLRTTTVFVAIMFVATALWIVIACVFHGRKHPALYDFGSARPSVLKSLCLSALVFVVVYGNLFKHGMDDLNDAFWNFERAEAAGNAVRIEVNAHQWAWDARYAGPDGQFNTPDDVVTLNDLVVPVGRPILVELASTDVVHSFSLPNFRTKQDAVPGMVNRLWFEAKRTGTFDIACAQHCGVNHYKMRGRQTVVGEPEYRAWEAEASTLGARSFDPEDKAAHWGWKWNERAGTKP
jgi:cytochrome c oxidase subunit 2